MMAPDYAHWHGMYEVAERFYQELIPQARELAEHAAESGNEEASEQVEQVIDEILQRPEHEWFEKESNPPPGEQAMMQLPRDANAALSLIPPNSEP